MWLLNRHPPGRSRNGGQVEGAELDWVQQILDRRISVPLICPLWIYQSVCLKQHILNVFDHRTCFYRTSLQPLKTGFHIFRKYHSRTLCVWEGNAFVLMDSVTMVIMVISKEEQFSLFKEVWPQIAIWRLKWAISWHNGLYHVQSICKLWGRVLGKARVAWTVRP